MAIWLHAREEFADNRFQLLFIYVVVEVRMRTLDQFFEIEILT